MTIQWTTENLGSALMLMLMGMLGIFVVMAIILVGIVLLNKFAKDKPKDDDQKGGSK